MDDVVAFGPADAEASAGLRNHPSPEPEPSRPVRGRGG
jgi:hypothetical protein